jgi:beta-lactamase class A
MIFSEIRKTLDVLPGKIGVYYKDLRTGNTFSYNENEAFKAASVIKLPILAATLHRIKQGLLRKDDCIRLKAEDKVPSCGALSYMHSGLEVTIMDLCHLMIILSDNTATNMLINLLGMDNINSLMSELGLRSTRVNRLLFDIEGRKLGKENYYAPAEIGCLLEQIYTKKLISVDICEDIIEIMKQQQINHKIPYFIPDEVKIAHKTGEDDGITHDVGIVYSKNPFILCFASNNTNVPQTEDALRKIAKQLYDHSLTL